MSDESQPQGADPRGTSHSHYVPPVPSPPQRGSGVFKGCLIAVVVVGLLGVIGMIGVVGLIVLGGATAGMEQTGGGVQFQEITIGGSGDDKIACISLTGIIRGDPIPGRELSPVALVAAQFDKAAGDQAVQAVVLYVDTPGGGITASDILYERIRNFRRRSGKPVVVCMMDMATSGGYYIAAGADKIVAHPTTITGSIGVMMPLYDATELMKKIGVRTDTITTGKFKEIASPFAEKTDEQREAERKILSEMIGHMYDRFVAVVAEGRGMEPQEVRDLADGRIFTSKQALELGLIDQIGYSEDAVATAKSLAGISQARLIQYRRVVTLADVLGAFAAGPRISLDVNAALPGPEASRPMYLWAPPGDGIRRESASP